MGEIWISKAETQGGLGTSLYKIRNFNNLVYNYLFPVEILPSAEDATESVVLLKIITNTLKLSFDYVITDEVTSPISGTTDFAGKTSAIDIKHFIDKEYGAIGKKSSSGDSFELKILWSTTDSTIVPDIFAGLVSGLTIQMSKEAPVTFSSSIEFTIGKPIGAV